MFCANEWGSELPSLFAGTDEIICDALGIAGRKRLSQPLQADSLSAAGASGFVAALYDQIEQNYPGRLRSRSAKLWSCRRETFISGHNASAETMLEKAVAMLANHGHMPNWFNQCPVATGVVDPRADRRRCVDLVNLSHEQARLVELKWGSDNTAVALFQVLEYGLAYLFARLRRRDLGLEARPIMQDSVTSVRLEVVAPKAFYEADGAAWLVARLDQALAGLAAKRSSGAWSMGLSVLAFPERLRKVPFETGADVERKCDTDTLTREGRTLRDAFDDLTPAHRDWSL